MGPAVAADLKPLPSSTAGKWLSVVGKDVNLVRHWMQCCGESNVCSQDISMCQFQNSFYHLETPLAGAYYYWTPEFNLALALIYRRRRKQHEITFIGARGKVVTSTALDLLLEKVTDYLRERSAISAFADVPANLSGREAQQVVSAIPSSAKARITVERDTKLLQRWNIELLSPTS